MAVSYNKLWKLLIDKGTNKTKLRNATNKLECSDFGLKVSSGKIKQVSVASSKFMIMMQACRDNEKSRELGKEWIFEDIQKHQEKMIGILF